MIRPIRNHPLAERTVKEPGWPIRRLPHDPKARVIDTKRRAA